MTMGRKDDFQDDGRVVADMSMIETGSFVSRLRRVRAERRMQKESQSSPPAQGASAVESTEDRKMRRYYTTGAVVAGLLIGAVYLVAFATVILIMLLAFGVL